MVTIEWIKWDKFDSSFKTDKLKKIKLLMELASAIANSLLDIGAVKISLKPPFTWTSGIKSPIYCDNRMLISHPKERIIIVDAFCDLVRSKNVDFIAGTATAGIPWASFVAQKLDLPMVYVRPEPKGHGAGKQIEGDLPSGKRVIMIEDLISTGGSSVKTALSIRNEGKCEIADVLAIVTYQLRKSEQSFKEANLSTTTLTDFSHLVEVARNRGVVTEQQVKLVLDFTNDPAVWWENFSK